MIKETREFRKDDVWLVQYGTRLMPLAILEVGRNHIRHKFGWDTATEWNQRAKEKIGRVRRILGIDIGWRFGVGND